MTASLLVQAKSESGNCVPVFTKSESDVVFRSGEKMEFVLHYKFGMVNTDIGTASITLDTTRIAGEKVFHTRVLGRTARIFDWFFKVREDFNSYFTCNGLVPVRFTRDTYEGGYVAKNEYNYMWDAADSAYIDATVFTTTLGKTMQMRLPLKPCTFDLPALFFFARNIDMSRVTPDVKYPMTFAIDEEVYNVYFIYKGKCTMKIKDMGTVKCLKFAAKLLEGQVFKGDDDLDIYIADDMNRLPVYFGGKLRVGDVWGRMTGASGLKYPQTAIIDKK